MAEQMKTLIVKNLDEEQFNSLVSLIEKKFNVSKPTLAQDGTFHYEKLGRELVDNSLPRITHTAQFTNVLGGLCAKFEVGGPDVTDFFFDDKKLLTLTPAKWESNFPRFVAFSFPESIGDSMEASISLILKSNKNVLSKRKYFVGNKETEGESNEILSTLITQLNRVKPMLRKLGGSTYGFMFEGYYETHDLAYFAKEVEGADFHIPDLTESKGLKQCLALGIEPETYVTKKGVTEVSKNPASHLFALTKKFLDLGERGTLTITLDSGNFTKEGTYLEDFVQRFIDLGRHATISRAGSLVTPTFIFIFHEEKEDGSVPKFSFVMNVIKYGLVSLVNYFLNGESQKFAIADTYTRTKKYRKAGVYSSVIPGKFVVFDSPDILKLEETEVLAEEALTDEDDFSFETSEFDCDVCTISFDTIAKKQAHDEQIHEEKKKEVEKQAHDEQIHEEKKEEVEKQKTVNKDKPKIVPITTAKPLNHSTVLPEKEKKEADEVPLTRPKISRRS